MTKRVGEWQLVGYGEDPVPASEYDVTSVANDMGDRAEAAGLIRDNLQRLADLDGWRGKAAEAFAEKAEEVLEDLGKVEDRYHAVAEALRGWSGHVGTARASTDSALTLATDSDETMRRHPMPPPGGELTPEQERDKRLHEQAETDLGTARSRLQSAMSALDDAADGVRGDIEDAADIWDDGFWGDVKGWVRDNADVIDAIVVVLEIIAAVVGIILLIVVIVATAPFWLTALAVGLAVAVVVGVALLAWADTGKRDWGDVGLAVAGLALTLVGGRAALLAGKGLSRMVPAIATRLGDAAESAALTRIIGSNAQRFAAASRIQNPANNLSRWVTGIRSTAAGEGATVRTGVEAMEHVVPSRLAAVVAQDRQVAQTAAALRELRTLQLTGPELARLSEIHRTIAVAIGANSGANAVNTVQIPGTVAKTIEYAQDPPWTTRPAS